MIDETILFLTHTDCGIPVLRRHGLGIGPNADFDSFFVQPLRKVFSKVIVYDMWKSYAEIGVRHSNKAIIDIVRAEHPKYLLWPTMMYEILESTLREIRQQGTLVVGLFFDDEIRFDNYSRWWTPYLDYCLTTDKESVKRYEELGCTSIHTLPVSNPAIFMKLDLPLLYDVTFVGRKFGDRGTWIEQLCTRGINAQAFGKGWSKGYVSTEQMVKIYNASKVNLCFVKSYGVNTRPQMKDKIFHVCMSGGFLLCEYIQGIEEFFEIDREIVCFSELNELIEKIEYYLSHEAERLAIARAGWERAQRDHTQASMLLNVFGKIEKNAKIRNRHVTDSPIRLDMPPHIRRLPSSYHLRWARGLMIEGYPRERWQEELDLALFYDPENKGARRLSIIGCFPAFARPGLIRLWAVLGRLKWTLHSRLRAIPVLRKIKQTLNKCRSLSVTLLKRMRWLPWELSLRFRGHSACFEISTDMTLPEKLLLYKLARGLRRGSVIVEVGSYLGASSTFLAAAARERGCVVYCVDTWVNDAMSDGPRDTYAEFLSNAQRYADQIRPLRGRSLEIAKEFSEPIDLLFLDADHSYAGCRSDVEAWVPKLKPGGFVVFHDFLWFEGVQRTVKERVKPIEQSPGHVMENIYWARVNPREEP